MEPPEILGVPRLGAGIAVVAELFLKSRIEGRTNDLLVAPDGRRVY
jgi:hypothetical protein